MHYFTITQTFISAHALRIGDTFTTKHHGDRRFIICDNGVSARNDGSMALCVYAKETISQPWPLPYLLEEIATLNGAPYKFEMKAVD